MQIEVKNIPENPVSLLRGWGYIFQRKEETEMSFIRPLSQSGYPRFHIYGKMVGADLVLNIHLDQKKETYGDSTRHHGEYTNDGALKEEVHRLKAFAENY
jgi:hypothetical protein